MGALPLLLLLVGPAASPEPAGAEPGAPEPSAAVEPAERSPEDAVGTEWSVLAAFGAPALGVGPAVALVGAVGLGAGWVLLASQGRTAPAAVAYAVGGVGAGVLALGVGITGLGTGLLLLDVALTE